jgi:hypothetical protein
MITHRHRNITMPQNCWYKFWLHAQPVQIRSKRTSQAVPTLPLWDGFVQYERKRFDVLVLRCMTDRTSGEQRHDDTANKDSPDSKMFHVFHPRLSSPWASVPCLDSLPRANPQVVFVII